MKRLILLLMTGLLSGSQVTGQGSRLKSTGPGYCMTTGIPVAYFKGDTVTIDCDTLYLMNPRRYAFYRELHKAFLSGSDTNFLQLIDAYESRLREDGRAYGLLLENSKKSEKISSDLIEYTRKTLEETEKTLANTQNTLDESIKNLALVNNSLRHARRKANMQKLYFGLGGAGIGLIAGILLAK